MATFKSRQLNAVYFGAVNNDEVTIRFRDGIFTSEDATVLAFAAELVAAGKIETTTRTSIRGKFPVEDIPTGSKSMINTPNTALKIDLES